MKKKLISLALMVALIVPAFLVTTALPANAASKSPAYVYVEKLKVEYPSSKKAKVKVTWSTTDSGGRIEPHDWVQFQLKAGDKTYGYNWENDEPMGAKHKDGSVRLTDFPQTLSSDTYKITCKRGKKAYKVKVRVRSAVEVNGKWKYSSWSEWKKVKIKKKGKK